MPFLTEELWHRLPQRPGARSISLERFPEPHATWHRRRSRTASRAAARGHRRRAQHPRGIEARPETPGGRGFLRSRDSAVRTLVEQQPRRRFCASPTLSGLHLSTERLDPNAGPVRSTSRIRSAHRLRRRGGHASRAGASSQRKRPPRARSDVEAKSAGRRSTFRSRAPAEIVRQLEATFAERRTELDKVSSGLRNSKRPPTLRRRHNPRAAHTTTCLLAS